MSYSKEQRRKDAEERHKNRRSAKDQIAHLDKRGFVAKKERARLAIRLAKENINEA